MATLILKDNNEREYQVSMNPISVQSRKELRFDDSCILVMAKENEAGFEIIGLHSFSPAHTYADHLASWDGKELDGRWIHVERQLGATHYGVIKFHFDYEAELYVEKLKQAYPNPERFNW